MIIHRGGICLFAAFLVFPGSKLHADEPPSLEAYIATLESCQPNFIEGQAKLRSKEAGLAAIRSQRLPSFSVSASGLTAIEGGAVANSQAGVRWPIVTFGRQSAEEQVAFQEVSLEAAVYSERLSNQILQLLELHTQISSVNQQMQILKQTIAEQENLKDIVSRRANKGMSSSAEIFLISAKVNRNIGELSSQRLQFEQLRGQVSALQCEEYNPTFEIEVVSNWLDVPQHNSGTSPTVQRLVQGLELSKSKFKLQQRQNSPTLNLEGKSPFTEFDKRAAQVGLSLSYQLENAGQALKYSRRQADLEIEASRSSLAAGEMQVATELAALENNIFEFNISVIPNQRTTVDVLDSTLASKRRLYQAGRVSLFELLSINDELMAARISLTRSIHDAVLFGLKYGERHGLFKSQKI